MSYLAYRTSSPTKIYFNHYNECNTDNKAQIGNLVVSYNVCCDLLLKRQLSVTVIATTRKLSCRKDDRAMRPIYGCPENFRESLSTTMATFPEIFNELILNELLFRLSL